MELDYKQMFMSLSERFNDKIQEEEKYFELLKQINDLKPYNNLVSARMYDLKIYEQCAIFQCILEIHKISKALCEKYGWDEEIQTEDG